MLNTIDGCASETNTNGVIDGENDNVNIISKILLSSSTGRVIKLSLTGSKK